MTCFSRGFHYVSEGRAKGAVEEIGVFTATLDTADNKKVIVPNFGITGGNIVNYASIRAG